jgi:hypothetical protein
MTPALLTRMCGGPSQAAANALTDDRSDSSSCAALNFPDSDGSSARNWSATAAPVPVLRTARVTSAPTVASARTVSTPMPELAPVTTARRPRRSTPSITSAAVEAAPKTERACDALVGCVSLTCEAAAVERANGLIVLTLAGDKICAITRFGDNSLFPHFGLPRALRD